MNKKLIKYVKAEAKLLRANVSHELLSKLDIETLNGGNPYMCVYGQIFGYSESSDAFVIKGKCNTLVCDMWGDIPSTHIRDFIIKGETCFYTPIERFICSKDKHDVFSYSNNKVLIDYLKGKRKTLRFIEKDLVVSK